jgi:hypothetical protein
MASHIGRIGRNSRTPILIVGGGLGGIAAALAATEAGCRVVLTEESTWLGGQMTAQLVPPDEHEWIERFGRTRRYAQLREGIRNYYRDYFPLTSGAMRQRTLNPGGGTVSPISHLPPVSVAVIDTMLLPAIASGRLMIHRNTVPVAADAHDGSVHSVRFLNRDDGSEFEISADYVLDATELGDLLPLAGIEYVSGAESQRETGEPHARQDADPEDVQAITWCLPLAYDPDCHEPRDGYQIERPGQYDFWKEYTPSLPYRWPGKLLGWKYWIGGRELTGTLFGPKTRDDEKVMWTYRRILSSAVFDTPSPWHEISVLNWWPNDFYEGNIIDKPPEVKARLLDSARQQSLSLAYWLQNDAPRPDGGQGYPGLYLRPDITGTSDGLAQYPYIRESRRIRALFTVTENHIGIMARQGRPPEPFADSCGVGKYHMDIHPTNAHRGIRPKGWSRSFNSQIPLGALIPRNPKNLIAAAKNIGTTHLANGAYRLHPIEWNIGEAAGSLAAFCLERQRAPAEVHGDKTLLEEYQQFLVQQGVELSWPQINSPAVA